MEIRVPSSLLMILKYDGMCCLWEVEMLGVSTPAAKNVDKLERVVLVACSPSKGGRGATVFRVPVETRGDRRRVQAALQRSCGQRLPEESCSRRLALRQGSRTANERELKNLSEVFDGVLETAAGPG